MSVQQQKTICIYIYINLNYFSSLKKIIITHTQILHRIRILIKYNIANSLIYFDIRLRIINVFFFSIVNFSLISINNPINRKYQTMIHDI